MSQSAPPPSPTDQPSPVPGSMPGAGTPPNITPNVASMLCYIPSLGWIASVFFLTANGYKQNRYVRFHALQGLFLFVAGMLAAAVFGAHRFMMVPVGRGAIPWSHWNFSSMIELAVVVIQVVGIVRTVKSEPFHIPVLGDLAERSMT